MSEWLSHYRSDESPWAFADDRGITYPIYSAGSGPDVVVLHELPGMVEPCLELGIILTRHGFRVHLPLLFDQPGRRNPRRNLIRLCISREIHAFAANKTSPLVDWLRALCRKLHAESGGRGIGVIGMCVTGNFALALVADESVLAPVVAQPGLPMSIHRAALALSNSDAEAVRERAARLGDKSVLGLRYERDWICPRSRFDTIQRLIGPAFDRFEVPGKKHATLTIDRNQDALDRTIAFLSERLSVAQR